MDAHAPAGTFVPQTPHRTALHRTAPHCTALRERAHAPVQLKHTHRFMCAPCAPACAPAHVHKQTHYRHAFACAGGARSPHAHACQMRAHKQAFMHTCMRVKKERERHAHAERVVTGPSPRGGFAWLTQEGGRGGGGAGPGGAAWHVVAAAVTGKLEDAEALGGAAAAGGPHGGGSGSGYLVAGPLGRRRWRHGSGAGTACGTAAMDAAG